MSSEVFRFKQFDIRHNRCSMKVGTDGVLLGAWASSHLSAVNSPLSTLDIGTGSGLIALMLAQRFPTAQIVGIDIDLPSVEQARENVLHSPFLNRIEILHQSFETFVQQSPAPFHLIVSNPPFYEEDTIGHIDSKNKAKHTALLSFEQLIEGVDTLLSTEGEFDVIIPYSAADRFIGLAAMHHLYLARRCDVRGGEKRPFKRSLLAFTNSYPTTDSCQRATHTTLTLNDSQGHRSADYQQLTQAFYLD